MKLSVSIGYQEPNDVTSAFTIELTTSAFRVNRQGILEVANSNLDRDPPNPGILTFQVTTPQHLGFFRFFAARCRNWKRFDFIARFITEPGKPIRFEFFLSFWNKRKIKSSSQCGIPIFGSDLQFIKLSKFYQKLLK